VIQMKHLEGVHPKPSKLGVDIFVQPARRGTNTSLDLTFWHRSCQPSGEEWGQINPWWASVNSHDGFHTGVDDPIFCQMCEWKPVLSQWLIMCAIYTALEMRIEDLYG